MTVQSNTGGGPEEFYGAQSGAGGKQGFYGDTPIEQQTVNLATTTTATTTALETSVNSILVALKTLGLIDSTAT